MVRALISSISASFSLAICLKARLAFAVVGREVEAAIALLSGGVTTAMALFTVSPTTAGGVAAGGDDAVGVGGREKAGGGGEVSVTLMPTPAGGVAGGGGEKEVVRGGLEGSPSVFVSHAEAARAGGALSRSSTPRPPRHLSWATSHVSEAAVGSAWQ